MSDDTTPADDILQRVRELAGSWTPQRDERLQRRSLDRADFDALADTGFLRLVIPIVGGGTWVSLQESGPTIVAAIRALASADPSLALVSSMHPSVLCFWQSSPADDDPAAATWRDQREMVFQTALDGHFWGTITSEPGSGGDVMATSATAEPTPDGSAWAIRGEKHFGSGSQIVSYMITTAKEVGADMPMALFIDMRDQTWDGTSGLSITRRWDGMGMKATQSHAVMLEGVKATAWAWEGAMPAGALVAAPLSLALFSAVIMSICDAALAEAERRLTGRTLRPYEDVAFTQAQVDHWMLSQAMDGLTRTLTTASPESAATAGIKAKLGMSDLAESFMSQLSRAVGGGAFSSSSPFASWYEDVRALGYLRPPWALAFDQLSAARQPD